MPPVLLGIDHVHVYVRDRAAAEAWYRTVLGLVRVESLASWADDRGPLTVHDRDDTVHIALFERPPQPNRAVVALRTSADGFAQWRRHLAGVEGLAVSVEDHALSMSLYFVDPDGNPYEITTYEYDAAKAAG
jgi:catechol 2,3-dioxygenase-like lactoylglutathione lyase family enzyme